ncbi:HU family DNA-binding protein [Spiroplasma endosymbiont of Virgichneumon dumeticola]|uniref:HU family DNA-binding protein n=1 Tax=Spiroplasma endosymbiont of Virgichneumon dumeticola TaxID=3139323 RepID=UPI0035C8B58D
MNAKELIEKISDKTNFNLEDIELVFATLIEEIMNTNQFQKNITIKGFGTFKISRVKSFVRTCKATNTQHTVSNYKYVRFVPHKKFKKRIRTKPPTD